MQGKIVQHGVFFRLHYLPPGRVVFFSLSVDRVSSSPLPCRTWFSPRVRQQRKSQGVALQEPSDGSVAMLTVALHIASVACWMMDYLIRVGLFSAAQPPHCVVEAAVDVQGPDG